MSHRPSRKKRVRHEIIMEILKLAKRGVKKTNIMREARISFDMLEKYLNALKEGHFITEKSGIWKTTQEGLHVIKACEICQRLIKEAKQLT